MKKKIMCALIIFCILLGFTATVGIQWLYDTFGNLSMDEIIFHLKVPMEGTSTDLIYKFFKDCTLKIIIPTIIVSFILTYPIIKDLRILEAPNKKTGKRTVMLSLCVSIAIFVVSINNVIQATDIKEYITNQRNDSTFIAEQYINPEETNIEFPEQKRNLIYIYLESMESTYYSKEDGGLAEQDLIPEITQLAKENTSFSTPDRINGAYTLYGTTWTVGAMTAQSAGIPLKLSIDDNGLEEYSSFLSGAYTIGEVLEDNGYHNFLLLGSDATFGGRRNLFTQHGNYEIWDFVSAMEEKRVTEKIWWGYTDNLLFEIAKEKITYLAEQDKPFNFTMLTADTHFTDGYLCEDCEDKWKGQYENVISCSSKHVGEFINWLKEQEFYDNTTIVISGDHLTMQPNFFTQDEGDEYKKTVLNLFINPAEQPVNSKNRLYSTMDLYPTTLGALGVKIEGNRLALGTNLFSTQPTLIEEYGIDKINEELMKTSKFYNNNILVSK